MVVDLFAGGGGASTGIEAALGRPVDIAINHDPIALAVHARNHPKTVHFVESVWRASPQKIVGRRRVDLLWASPDCTHFSNAKGDVPKKQHIRSLAWVVVKWAQQVRPSVIMLENVREFRGWGPLGRNGKPIKARMGETFDKWCTSLERLGYSVDWRVLDASEYGAPTRRRRLFVVARADGKPIAWPEPTHGEGLLPLHTAAECIDFGLEVQSIFGRKKPLAEKTHWRIAQGVFKYVLDNPEPFIIKVNHGRREARVESLGKPLSTVTAKRRGHAMVAATLVQTGYGERKGQRPRVPGLGKPLGTVVGCGQKHALVGAWMVRHFGDPRRKRGGGRVVGKSMREPVPTVTGRDHHSYAAVALAKFRGTRGQKASASVLEPLPTISSGGKRGGVHVAEVRAFLTTYYGNDGTGGQDLRDPTRTLTSRHRLGLVTVHGVDYQIVDIGMRMLEPHELLRAQFGKYARGYDLSLAHTKAKQVHLVGNSVPPELVEALVVANVAPAMRRAA